MSECGQRDDRHDEGHLGGEVIELVLGHAAGRQRVEMTSHLLQCPACREDYDELAAAVGEVLPGVPAVQPPLGFDAAVLDRLARERTAPAPPTAQAPASPRPAGRRLWLAAAAVVALLAAGLVGLVAGNFDDGSTASAAAPIRTTGDGRTVGTASVADIDGEDVLVVALLDAPPDVSYTCTMLLRDGSKVTTDPWPAMARGAWVVDIPGGDGDELEGIELVVTDTDRVWSSAAL